MASASPDSPSTSETTPALPSAKTSDASALISELTARGHALQQQGKLNEAARLYEQILRINPQDFNALHLLGSIGLINGQTQSALTLFESALRVRPDHAAAHINRGIALQRLKAYERALECYDRALAMRLAHAPYGC